MIDYAKLAEPFREDEIEWRIQQSGEKNGKPWAKVLAYVQARAVQNRLDEVVGPENWKASYEFVTGGIICHLSIRTSQGDWVTKCDGAEPTDIESFKGGLSSALKRAAVVWSLGRYLYKLESTFAEIVPSGTKGSYYAPLKGGGSFNWLPPQLPDWALPKSTVQASEEDNRPVTTHDYARVKALMEQNKIPFTELSKVLTEKYGQSRFGELTRPQLEQLITEFRSYR